MKIYIDLITRNLFPVLFLIYDQTKSSSIQILFLIIVSFAIYLLIVQFGAKALWHLY